MMKIAALAVATFVSLASATPCETLLTNKQTALAYLDGMFNKHDISVVDKYIGTTYAQHSPLAPDGPETLKSAFSMFGNSTKVEFGEVVASGNLVWINARYSGFTNMNTSVAVNVFRLDNGKIVEHWETLQEEVPANKTASGRPMFPIRGNTPLGSDGCDTTSDAVIASNKKLAVAFIEDLFNKHDFAAAKYVGPIYAQHSPFAPDGLGGLAYLLSKTNNSTAVKIGAIAAGGDLVWVNTHYTGVKGLATSIGIDVMRFAYGRIIEHWVILEAEVPTLSGRPMFPIAD